MDEVANGTFSGKTKTAVALSKPVFQDAHRFRRFLNKCFQSIVKQ